MALSSSTLRIGDIAPGFTLPDLDGRSFELADVLEGGATLLVFAPGTWSPDTRRQILELEQGQSQLEGLGVTVLMIITEKPRQAKRVLGSLLSAGDRSLTGPLLSFPVLVDEDRETARDYGVYRAFSLDGIAVTRPAAFLVDGLGVIRFAYVGRTGRDLPDTKSLLALTSGLVATAGRPVALLGPGREVREWNTSTLPRVSKPTPPPELAEPTTPIALPIADPPLDGSPSGQGETKSAGEVGAST